MARSHSRYVGLALLCGAILLGANGAWAGFGFGGGGHSGGGDSGGGARGGGGSPGGGFLGGHSGGGDSGGNRGGGGGLGALVDGLAGGIASAASGGSFGAGFKAGVQVGIHGGGLGAAITVGEAVGKATDRASSSSSDGRSTGWPFGAGGQTNPGGNTPSGNAYGVGGWGGVDNGRPPAALDSSQAQAAAAQAAAAQAQGMGQPGSDGVAGLGGRAPGVGLPHIDPSILRNILNGTSGGTGSDPNGQGDSQTSPQPTANADLAAPLATPAAPQPMASVDAPKRYQVDVPPLPPGRQYKGSDGGENYDPNKLADVVKLPGELSVDPGAMAPPSSNQNGGPAGIPGPHAGSYGKDAETFVRAHVTDGESKLGLKDYNGAVADAQAAIQAAPNKPDGYLLLARTYNRMGNYADAERVAMKARDLASDFGTKARAQQEVVRAELYQGRTADALASTAQAVKLAEAAGDNGLLANAYYLGAAACQLKGDRACMIDALARAALLDAKYAPALAAAKAGKNIFDPKDKDSLGLLDEVNGGVPEGLGGIAAALLAVFAALATGAGLAWRKARAPAPPPTLAESLGVKKDDGLLGGRYELGRSVPSGGRGEMWEARDKSLDRQALALRLPSAAAADEAKRLAQVHHPGIIDVFEVIETPQASYLVTEYVKGRTLRQVLASRGRLGVDEARRLLRPVCEALEFARGQGVVHGGLELSGIMMSDDGYVKVLDLAGARPEAAGRTDVQALAACLQELLTGEPPRAGQAPACVAADVAALLAEAAAGAVPGPQAFAARLERLSEGVAVG